MTSPLTLNIPRQEARLLEDTGAVTLLFPVEAVKIEGYDELFCCGNATEANYPAIDSAPNPDFDAVLDESVTWARYRLRTAAQLWNFMGDATHCSELIPTPYRLKAGDALIVENQLNVSPFSAVVKNIAFVRVQGASMWAWLVSLERAS